MNQNSSSSHRFDKTRVESVRRRRSTVRKNSKIILNNDEKNHSKISQIQTWLASSEVVSNKEDSSFSIPKKESFSLNSITNPSEKEVLPVNNSIISNNKDLKPKSQTRNHSWKYILMIIYGVLCIIFLIILILPSIFVYILAPKSFSTTTYSLSPQNVSHCAGISPNSLWQIDNSTTITMKVDTSECAFSTTPLYIISIAGTCSHHCLTGYGSIYLPTRQSFQIYTRYSCAVWNATDLLSSAQSCGWDVNWMGFIN